MELTDDHSGPKQEIIERIKSMVFLCIDCNSPTPMSTSLLDLEHYATGSFATAFFICPNCRHKFTVKIQDVGKIGKFPVGNK